MAIIFFFTAVSKMFSEGYGLYYVRMFKSGNKCFLANFIISIHWKIYFLKLFPCFLHLVYIYIYIFKIFINLFFILIENPKQEWLNKYFFLQF